MSLESGVYLPQDHPSSHMCFDKETEAAFPITQWYNAQYVNPL